MLRVLRFAFTLLGACLVLCSLPIIFTVGLVIVCWQEAGK